MLDRPERRRWNPISAVCRCALGRCRHDDLHPRRPAARAADRGCRRGTARHARGPGPRRDRRRRARPAARARHRPGVRRLAGPRARRHALPARGRPATGRGAGPRARARPAPAVRPARRADRGRPHLRRGVARADRGPRGGAPLPHRTRDLGRGATAPGRRARRDAGAGRLHHPGGATTPAGPGSGPISSSTCRAASTSWSTPRPRWPPSSRPASRARRRTTTSGSAGRREARAGAAGTRRHARREGVLDGVRPVARAGRLLRAGRGVPRRRLVADPALHEHAMAGASCSRRPATLLALLRTVA